MEEGDDDVESQELVCEDANQVEYVDIEGMGLVDIGINEEDLMSGSSLSTSRSESDSHEEMYDLVGDDEACSEASGLTPRTKEQRARLHAHYDLDINSISQQSPANIKLIRKKRRKRRPKSTSGGLQSKPGKLVETFFREMDEEFVNRTNLDDEVYVFAASDVLVQKMIEIPIVAQWPNTRFEYEFRSEPSEVKFSVSFVAALEPGQTHYDLEVENIYEGGVLDTTDATLASNFVHQGIHEYYRSENTSEQDKEGGRGPGGGRQDIHSDLHTASHKQAVRGSFTADREGIVFFIFDVNDDWWLSSLFAQEIRVSYRIASYVPSFTYADTERSKAAAVLLEENTEAIREGLCTFYDLESGVTNNLTDVAALQEEITLLEQLLDLKFAEQSEVQEVEYTSLVQLTRGYELLNGLCIRVLNHHLLGYVMGYLVPTATGGALNRSNALSAVGLVSKYWNECYLGCVYFGTADIAEKQHHIGSNSPDHAQNRIQRAEILQMLRSKKEDAKITAALQLKTKENSAIWSAITIDEGKRAAKYLTLEDKTINPNEKSLNEKEIEIEKEKNNKDKVKEKNKEHGVDIPITIGTQATHTRGGGTQVQVEDSKYEGPKYVFNKGNTTAENIQIAVRKIRNDKRIRRQVPILTDETGKITNNPYEPQSNKDPYAEVRQRINVKSAGGADPGADSGAREKERGRDHRQRHNKERSKGNEKQKGAAKKGEVPRSLQASAKHHNRLTNVSLALRADLQAQTERIDKIMQEKARVKEIIKNWTSCFFLENERHPSVSEKKDLLGSYYEEYARIDRKYKAKTLLLMQSLLENGLSPADLDELQEKDEG